jgi:hypothetical protein
LEQPDHGTLGHQAADDLPDRNGADSTVWLSQGSQGRTTDPRGKQSGRPTRGQPIHKFGKGIRGQGRGLGRWRMEHISQVRMAKTRNPRGGPVEKTRQCGFDF